MADGYSFRRAAQQDLPALMRLLDGAKAYLKQMGLPQWQNGYPDHSDVLKDIQNENAYILEGADKTVLAMASLVFGEEPDYHTIYEGEWLQTARYATIHRLAVGPAARGGGAGAAMVQRLQKICCQRGVYALRSDTHPDNRPMRGLLQRCGFSHCGTIYLVRGGDARAAYEMLLPPAE